MSTIVILNVFYTIRIWNETLVLMCFGKSFCDYRELKIDCWTLRHILCEKILNYFVCLEVRILVEKRNIYEGHIFLRPLLQTCRLETTSVCLNAR